MNALDGAYIGTSFPHIFLLTFKSLFIASPSGSCFQNSQLYNPNINENNFILNKSSNFKYVPRIFGYKVRQEFPKVEKASMQKPVEVRDLFSNHFVKYNHDNLFADSEVSEEFI